MQKLTHLHLSHVLHYVLQVLVASETGKLISNHLLPIPCQHLSSILGRHPRESGLIRFNEESRVRSSRVGHGEL